MEELDCKGMICPMPVVVTARKMNELQSGDQLKVVADDKGFEADIKAWTAATGNPLVSFEHETSEVIAIIKKQ